MVDVKECDRTLVAEKYWARVREKIDAVVKERDELRGRAEKAESEANDMVCLVRTIVSDLSSARAELEELRVRLAATQGVADGTRKSLEERTQELEKLRVKATPGEIVENWARWELGGRDSNGNIFCPRNINEAAKFILSLAPAPKRKTRLEAAIEHERKQVGASKLTPCEEARIAGLLTAAGVPLDEELP